MDLVLLGGDGARLMPYSVVLTDVRLAYGFNCASLARYRVAEQLRGNFVRALVGEVWVVLYDVNCVHRRRRTCRWRPSVLRCLLHFGGLFVKLFFSAF